MKRLSIDPATWPQLSALLDAALDRAPAAREAWLASLGDEHSSLLPQLRELLAEEARVESGDFLRQAPALDGGLGADEGVDGGPAVDERIGPYRLVRELGRGGMGVVWLAERADGLFNRPVALKLPHPMALRAGLAERLAREREILATLDHPHIARLYDAGVTASGQPYLALEFVAGRDIDRYCEEVTPGTSATVDQRLRLFLQVADAVAFAHRRLVLHRDLKPANIQVTAEGEVRLLDFGIAKLLEAGRGQETRLTEMSGRALTPDYASPEQILGEPLTVASDVYSLGVVLYELLTGQRPYRLKRDSRGALEDAILQGEPRKPSEVAPEARRADLRGDLDTIVLKALKKRPDERYHSVTELAEDLTRHLEHRPVLAQPDRIGYRLGKFLRRNRLPVGAGVAVAIALIAGMVVALWQAQRAERERDRALLQQQRAERVKNLMVDMFRNAEPEEGSGTPLTASDLLRNAARTVEFERFDDPAQRAEVQRVLGDSLIAIDDLDAATPIVQDAIRRAEQDFPAGHVEIARARLLRCALLRFRGDKGAWRSEQDILQTMLPRLEGNAPTEYVQILIDRADLEIDAGNYRGAADWARRASAASVRLTGGHTAENEAALELLALSHTYLGETPEAIAAARRAYDLARELYAGTGQEIKLVDSRVGLARALAQNGQLRIALQEFQAADGLVQRAFGEKSIRLGFLREHEAHVMTELGLAEESIRMARNSLAIADQHRLARDSYSYNTRRAALAEALLAAGQPSQAVPVFREAIAVSPTAFGKGSVRTLRLQTSMALALAEQGRIAEGSQLIDRTIAAYPPEALTNRPTPVLVKARIAALRGDRSLALQLTQSLLRAEPLRLKRVELAEAQLQFGQLQLEKGDKSAAARSFDEALRTLSDFDYADGPVRKKATRLLASVRQERG